MGQLIQFPRPYVGPLSKAELHRAIGKSKRWIELRQRDDGLPYSRDADGNCLYDLQAVNKWKRAYEAERKVLACR